MILIIRGHIRDSFTKQDLLNFIRNIYIIEPNIKIYIHTWNIFQNNISWRKIEIDNTPVTRETVYNYFDDLKHLIQEIIIDDDNNIELIGNLKGNINNALMPIIGWKNYWYGKYKIIKYIYDKYDKKDIENEMIINTRFDIITGETNGDNYLDFIKNNKNTLLTKNKFVFDYEWFGIDNIYIGNINTMYTLIHKFHHELDDILKKNTDSVHQELFVYRENKSIFN